MAKNNKGFTLLELLVSLAIISIILLGFFRALDSTSRMNIKNDRDIKALNLVQSEIENLRNQIKTLKEPKLNIDGKDIYINNNEKVYDGKYQKKSGEKQYDVNLKINKRDIGKDMYLFDIDISVQVIAEDKYFSSKSTRLTTSILSNNKSNGSTEKPPIVELPEGTIINQHHEINIYSGGGYFNENLDREVYTGYLVHRRQSSNFEKPLDDKKFNAKDLNIKIEYKPNSINQYNTMKIIVTYSNGKKIESYHEGNKDWGATYTPFNKIQILTKGKVKYYGDTYGFDAGVTLKNVRINGFNLGDITGSKVYSIENSQNGAIIEFDGFIKNDNIDPIPNHTKVFFMFE